MGATVVQFKHRVSDSSTQTVLLDAPPTVGNLLIGVQFGIFNALNTPDWTLIQAETNGSFPDCFLAYRYVQSGDNYAGFTEGYNPYIGTGTAGYGVDIMIEIGGVTGDPMLDIIASAHGTTASFSPSTEDTPSATATINGQLCIGIVCSPNTVATPTINDGAFTSDILEYNQGSYGIGIAVGHASVSAGAHGMNVTYQWSGVQHPSLFTLILGPESAPAEDSNSLDSNSNSNDVPEDSNSLDSNSNSNDAPPPTGGRRGIIVIVG